MAQIQSLLIYPIKSCAEQSVCEAVVTPRGFFGDRAFQITHAMESRYLTPREAGCESLFFVEPTLSEDHSHLTLRLRGGGASPLTLDIKNKLKQPRSTDVVMTTTLGVPRPNDNKEPLVDLGDTAAKWLSQVLPAVQGGCRLSGIGATGYRRMVVENWKQGEKVEGAWPVSLADEAPFLLCSEASLRDLNRRLQTRRKKCVDMRRFRPNIVVDDIGGAAPLEPFEEDTWKKIRIGGASGSRSVDFLVWQRCSRCVMTTIDRDSLEKSSEPLDTLSLYRERAHGCRNFGVHLIPIPSSCGKQCDPMEEIGKLALCGRLQVLEYDEGRRLEWSLARKELQLKERNKWLLASFMVALLSVIAWSLL